MLNRQAIILATIRTAVPAAIGWLIAWLIGRVPAVADIIDTLDGVLAEAVPGAALTVTTLLNAAAVGLAVGAYYWVARELGRRWPIVERFLLGSSAQPLAYAKQTADGVFLVTALPDPKVATRAEYQAAIDPHNPAAFRDPGAHNEP